MLKLPWTRLRGAGGWAAVSSSLKVRSPCQPRRAVLICATHPPITTHEVICTDATRFLPGYSQSTSRPERNRASNDHKPAGAWHVSTIVPCCQHLPLGRPPSFGSTRLLLIPSPPDFGTFLRTGSPNRAVGGDWEAGQGREGGRADRKGIPRRLTRNGLQIDRGE
jgi:hypothetical protein